MASDPYRYFRIEARELVEGLSQGVLELEKGARGSELVARLLRLAHTLKGAARVVKKLDIADRSHEIEEVLSPLREAGRDIGSEQVRTLLSLVDDILASVNALAPAAPDKPASTPEPHPSPAVHPPLADEVFQTVRVDVEEMDDLLRAVTETGVQVAALKRDLVDLRRLAGLSTALASRLSLRARAESRAGDATELGLALDLQSGFERLTQALFDRAERVDQELGDVRHGADRLRLIPAQTLSATLARAVRDAAQSLGKSVEFELVGGALRLDAPMLGPLRDAFLHLVRNAVAHGIESPIERENLGKPQTGKVRLNVRRRGSDGIFTCEDDGRGVDVTQIRRELVARGTLTLIEAERLSREELLKRLLSVGMTTAAQVTQISGRGIGLDVLRDTAAKLKGEVSIASEPGKGTAISLRFPLSLASLRALVVEAVGIVVAIPLDAVQESRRIAPDDFRQSAQGDTVAVGDVVLPFLALGRVLKPASAFDRKTLSSAVIVHADQRTVAIGVDALRGAFEIVVKPLPPGVPIHPVVASVSLDGEGTPRLVLDPSELVRAAYAERSSATERPAERLPILVIDDSLTTRMLEQSILESAGYEVEVAIHAEQGLEKARTKPYAAFLVDVEMPGMSGFEFVTLTRADPELKHIPAILVTSRDEPEDFERGRRAGASDYIVKGDFDQKRLLATIERLLGQ